LTVVISTVYNASVVYDEVNSVLVWK